MFTIKFYDSVQDALNALHEYRGADDAEKPRLGRKLANATEILVLAVAERDAAVAELFDRHTRDVRLQRQA